MSNEIFIVFKSSFTFEENLDVSLSVFVIISDGIVVIALSILVNISEEIVG